jgi:hypothetical protein
MVLIPGQTQAGLASAHAAQAHDQGSISCGSSRKEVEYRAWKVRALADLANRHDVKAGIIPERHGGGSTSRAARRRMPRIRQP